MPEVYCHPVIKKVVALHAVLLSVYPGTLRVIDVLDQQANTLMRQFRAGDDAVGIQLSNWLPECAGMRNEETLKQELTIHHMRLAVAREHGFDSWEEAVEEGDQVLDTDFEFAVDAALSGNVKKLRQLLDLHPDLATRGSQYGHGASLLIYLAANGVETWRQVVPENAPHVMKMLIDAGADIHAVIKQYGGKHTALELLLSSAHPREAGILEEMADLLKDPA